MDLPKGLFREYFVGEEEVWLESDEESVTHNDGDTNANTSTASNGRIKAKETIQGGEFGINLTTVLECFSILSKNHKPKHPATNTGEFSTLNNLPLCMSYDRDSATFHLEFLDEGKCLVTCEIPGVAVDESTDAGLAGAFRSSPLLGRAIFHSDGLSAAVGELGDVLGASVVEVHLGRDGMELGVVGPRSEVWVKIPYLRGGGMYVGLECYSDQAEMVRRYPLSAFLTGMRGLDIGCETCISVNSRGMMAIQHQVSREEDGSGVRPSFVDFIMTCMEDEVDEEGRDANASVVGEERQGMRDVTNDAFVQEEVSIRDKSVYSNRSRRKCPSQTTNHEEDESSQSSEDEQNANVSFHGGSTVDQTTDHDATKTNTRSTATSRILGELEVDNDIMSSHIAGTNKGRMSALADIRRRRELRQSMHKKNDTSDNDSEEPSVVNSSSRKRHSSTRDESDSEQFTHSSRKQKNLTDTPQDTTGYDTHSESENSESEHEDSLDVTADIPQIFSKSSSLHTSRHGSRRSSEGVADDGESDDETEEEPRMMYGDTKLEFTQDGYGSDDSKLQ